MTLPPDKRLGSGWSTQHPGVPVLSTPSNQSTRDDSVALEVDGVQDGQGSTPTDDTQDLRSRRPATSRPEPQPPYSATL